MGEARVIFVDDFAGAAGEGVRRKLAEDVAHVRACLYEHLSPTLPHLVTEQEIDGVK